MNSNNNQMGWMIDDFSNKWLFYFYIKKIKHIICLIRGCTTCMILCFLFKRNLQGGDFILTYIIDYDSYGDYLLI